MQSKAKTVAEYLAELPEERRAALEAVRRVILENLGEGFEEGMQYGVIGYFVPHRIYPAGYHCDPKQPLPFAALASQKNYLSLYLMSVYAEGAELEWFEESWKATGRKLDMGKCCVRFRRVEDVALEVVGEAIRRVPVERHVAHYEATTKRLAAKAERPSGGARPKAKKTAKAGVKKSK